MYPFFRTHSLLSLVHPWNQTGQSVLTLMVVSVVVIVVQRPPSPQLIPRRSVNAMVVVAPVVVVVDLVAVVQAHILPSNANNDLIV